MNRCKCGKAAYTVIRGEPICADCDDAPLAAPIWNYTHSTTAYTNIMATIARIEARIAALEQIIQERTADS